MHQKQNWEEHLPLVDFEYNFFYQESLRMNHFKALYGWSCNTPISWSDPISRVLIGLDILADMEHEMQVINKNIKSTQDSQSSYVDKNRLLKEFQVGEHVYLCIKTKKSSLWIRSCAKLGPLFCGPFNTIERIGLVTY